MRPLQPFMPHHDPRICYRGENPTRLDALTDAVFGIAITLLIFNLANPNSFADLLGFTKTLPAFLISIGFLAMIWAEHQRFSEIYSLHDGLLRLLNMLFIALVIFYVYPLRFLTLFLTQVFFATESLVRIGGNQVPWLMVYYGFVAFGLYFTLHFFYWRALRMQQRLQLNAFEVAYTRAHLQRLRIMFVVPLLSVLVAWGCKDWSALWASLLAGCTYNLYLPAIFWWYKGYNRLEKSFAKPQS